MKHVCDGLGNKEISEKMGRSVDTVRNLLRRALARLGASNRTSAAVIYATQARYLPNDVDSERQQKASQASIDSWADPVIRAKRMAWRQH